MSLPDFLCFEPVPVRHRHDGWSPAHQRRFVLALARGAGLDEAARSVGRSRQSAYALRRRRGAEGFARAWDEALAFAFDAQKVGRAIGNLGGGLELLLVPRFYRGRLIGFVHREDRQGMMAKLSHLDRLVAAAGGARLEEDFDTLAARAGEDAAGPRKDDKVDEMRW